MPRHLATLVFTNVTPLWTGGPLGGATYNILGDKVIGPWLLDAKSIIGRVRWLLRAAEASARARAGSTPLSLKDVDNIASRIFGDTNYASKIIMHVHVIPDQGLLPQNNDCEKCYVPVNPVLYKRLLDLAKHLASLPRDKRSDLGSMLEVDTFIEMRKRLGLRYASKPYLGRKSIKKYQVYQNEMKKHLGQLPPEILKVIAIPRVRLLLQGTENITKMVTHQPLPPRTITLYIEFYERASSSLSSEEAKLAVVATVYTLAFLGVGKAVSRGFGRFFLAKPPEIKEPVNEVEGLLEWFREARLSNPHDAERVFRGTGRWIVEQTCKLLSLGPQCLTAPQQPPWLLVPSLDVAISLAKRIDNVRHPCPYAFLELAAPNKPGCCDNRKPVTDILEALSAVGRATMKATWKLCSNAGVTAAGPNYHTWVLGLPRQGKSKIKGVATGYLVADTSLWARSEHCYFPDQIVLDFVSEARRASSIIVTSHCGMGGCYALIEPFTTLNDFVELLTGQTPLIHVGVHGSLIHMVGVYYAATNSKLGANNCPKDDGSIVYPPPRGTLSPPPKNPQEVVNEASKAAVEWLEFLLS